MAPVIRRKTKTLGSPPEDEIINLPARVKTSSKAVSKEVAGASTKDLTDDDVRVAIEDASERPSSFGYKLPIIQQYLKDGDFQKASQVTKAALAFTLAEMIPMAEGAVRTSHAKDGIYQFNSLVSKLQEVLVDLDGERDMNETIQALLDDAVRPQFMLLAQSIIQFTNSFKRQLKAEMDAAQYKVAADLFDDSVRELATYVQSMYGDVQRRIDKKMSTL